MPSYILGIACLVSSAAVFGVYISCEKGSVAKKIGLALLLPVLAASIILFAGFDVLADRIYVSSEVLSSKTSDLVVIEKPNYYLVCSDEGYEFLYIGEAGKETGTFIDIRYIHSDKIRYDTNEVPQVIEEEVAKGYYKKWLFLESGIQNEKYTEYKFIIPSEKDILYK